MGPFAGWNMPIFYTSIAGEHEAVRRSAGVFDISHMGEFFVRGGDAEDWLNGILSNDVGRLEVGKGQYTLMLDENAGVIDDLILYRTGPGEYLLVVNAARIGEVEAWLAERISGDVEWQNMSDVFGGMAVQGPEAASLWDRLATGIGLPPRYGIDHGEVTVCRTGYTGEDGFELFVPEEVAAEWFQKILDAGATPCGLGARDTLRLEKGYPLNGSDLDREHTALEAGLGRFVSLEKPFDFPGRAALLQQRESEVPRKLRGLVATGKCPPPRSGYPVVDGESGAPWGTVTSGGVSPTLGKGIAMAYLPAAESRPGVCCEIEVRGRRYPFEVVKKPFV